MCINIYVCRYIHIHTYICINIYVPQHVAEGEGDDEELRDAVERRERQCVHLCMRP